MDRDELRAEVAQLFWCMNEGYLLAEDREIVSKDTIFTTPEDMLHPDDLAAKPGFLSLADALIADMVPLLTETMAEDWRNTGHGVMFNHKADNLTPTQRVGKWLREWRMSP